ncbi:MAG: ceramide glucosyltransferase [Hyphomicrobium sp.]|uniref:ceramide glucosyltransferase n=1 Tax=Hyphomicrobium sp. TaxID=82 RepID=UPI00132499E2|nr:ceramide glucosyltransferase [Hyphomicrobium sp.]KAB2938566.1 MAG: glycosyltransferase [Hyphomicrobium sp.]MBZ0211485.1 ceramide glucosyltransferase [Hyphomicrobium sp.]
MNEIAWGCVLFVCLATLLHFTSALLAVYRSRRGTDDPSFTTVNSANLPPISVLRPVCGLDPHDELTLRSSFQLAYQRYELILCCDDADDPVVPVIRRLIGEYPQVDAKLLIGRDTLTSNPKLNNLIKGWRSARHAWVVMADSNVLMPTDYLQRLLAGWRADTGLLCAPPIGCMPDGFWAEVECAFLNTYQARWQYAADTVGLGFAQGKTMLWRRADLERAGGIRALGAEIAEDAAATKVVRHAGKRVRLVDRAFGQPLGRRGAKQIWSRQVRWAKLRRATFPLFFLPEILSGSAAPLLAAAYVAAALDVTSVGVVAALAAAWYGCEAVLARAAGWHLTALSPLAWVARDLILPVVWVQAWLGNSFSWRGNDMHLADAVPSN